jgi:dimethylhistidine N-methyltransferase
MPARSRRSPDLASDVSESILKESSLALVEDYDALTIRGFSGTYEQALGALHPAPAPTRMFIFLGSTIGNFNDTQRAGFFEGLRAAMGKGEFLLLGFDRQKDPAVLDAAYNDAEGLTAAFNLNILSHLNARFDGNFDTGQFRHVAFYDPDKGRIEMHLESLSAQSAALAGLGVVVGLEAGERIHTEISQKFDADTLAAELAGHGFSRVALWSDARNWFSLMLLRLGGTGAA